jgi:DNA-binding YbaB/EbfC family protein
MVNIQQIMKQAKAMQDKMMKMQEELAQKEFEGKAGGGMVTAFLNGKGELLRLQLDKSAVDPEDTELLSDLIVAAFNDAKKKSDEAANNAMSGVAGGMGLPPGFKMPF